MKAYYPLILVLSYLIGAILLIAFKTQDFSMHTLMPHFMGGFFIVFSFFKLLDLRGFADSYQNYDIVAKSFRPYAFAYPFIELILGAAYLTGFEPKLTNAVTLVVMGVSSIGVIKGLMGNKKFQCACLGAVFNIPMSKVALIEDVAMFVMAGVYFL